MQDVNGRVFGRQFIGEFAGAVGRIVVHHQQVHRNRESEQPLRQREQVLSLVIGRYND
jgi:hypothetical protein